MSTSDGLWRAVRLQNKESVDYINKLFRQGWYLMKLDVEGLPFLLFNVPLSPPKKGELLKRTIQATMPAGPDSIPVVVLTHGRIKGRQLALHIPREENGYVDLGNVSFDRTEWDRVTYLQLEEDGMVVICERRETVAPS